MGAPAHAHAGTNPVTKVLYPGSFDPIHNGHLELVETASHLFDEVVVAAMRNPQKGEPLFDLDEREEMIEESRRPPRQRRRSPASPGSSSTWPRRSAPTSSSRACGPSSDFESEMHQAQMNHAVSGVHTLFIPSASAHSFLASKLIREIARFGGDVSLDGARPGGQAPRREVRDAELLRRPARPRATSASLAGAPEPAASCHGSDVEHMLRAPARPRRLRPARCRCRPR